MRTFHITWFAFFLSFFGWFAVAALGGVLVEEFGLTKAQFMETNMVAVASTIVARVGVGRLCDRFGPRRVYTWLLVLGALPVGGVALAEGYVSLLVFRALIGTVGAAFVVTQYHTSLMFDPKVVGTANATTAGWGNLGGGAAKDMVIPFLFSTVLIGGFGLAQDAAWRVAMVIPAVAMLAMAVVYYRYTRDTPDGDFAELRARNALPAKTTGGSFGDAAKDSRTWILFVVYALCFGLELTMNSVLIVYFGKMFGLSLQMAGIAAATFGLMNLFARTLGGYFSDKSNARWGLQGRVWFLGASMMATGAAFVLFSQMETLAIAVATLMLFGFFVKTAQGGTFALVPFVNKRSLGSVAGIVGAGGNVGAVIFMYFLRKEDFSYQEGFLYFGIAVIVLSTAIAFLRFEDEPATPGRALEEGEGTDTHLDTSKEAEQLSTA